MIWIIIFFVVAMIGVAGRAVCDVDDEYGGHHIIASPVFAVMSRGGSLLCAASFVLYLLGII